MEECGGKSAERPEAGCRSVGQRRQIAPGAAGHGQLRDLRPEGLGHMRDQRAPVRLEQGLVRAKAGRPAARQNDAEDPQAVSSNSSRPMR